MRARTSQHKDRNLHKKNTISMIELTVNHIVAVGD